MLRNQIPLLLIIIRLLLGFFIVILIHAHWHWAVEASIASLVIGLLTDVFDGMIARKLQISTTKLRRLDSTVDLIFFLCVAWASYVHCTAFFRTHTTLLLVLLGSEACTYLYCFLKFRKEIATHTIAAKFWTLLLVATLIEILASCESPILFPLCCYLGILTRIEIILIIWLLPTWTNDVPSVYHAYLLKKGKPIQRNRLFNG